MIPSSLSTPCGNCLEEKSRKLYNWGIVKIVSNPYGTDSFLSLPILINYKYITIKITFIIVTF